MNTTADQQPKSDFTHIRECERCGIRYDWRTSPSSSLKMTYCGSLCENAALGFTIEAALKSERGHRLPELDISDLDLSLDPETAPTEV